MKKLINYKGKKVKLKIALVQNQNIFPITKIKINILKQH